MTKDPVKRSANNARYYQNRKARQGRQINNNNDDFSNVEDPLSV